MIDIRSLRIGNWVIFIPTKSFEVVDCIKMSGAVGLQGNLIMNNEKDIDPIPLTPEWLEKCGFEKRKTTEDGEYWGILNFTLLYAMTNTGLAWFLDGYHNDCHIEYLHQLQNIFYGLRKEELTINI